ncbi:MAG TPA: hypothetical protein VGV15_12295 [Terriglobales bacterium]|nr:hypothetical protein [Terriglobales bacterium]
MTTTSMFAVYASKGDTQTGGHFAAWEQPALHAKEIRDCFAKVR